MKISGKRKILITGVAGAIGSHLLDELLLRGEKVVGVDDLSFGKIGHIAHRLKDRNFAFHKLDVCDYDSLKKVVRDPDIIVHLAARKKVSEHLPVVPTLTVNSRGTDSILRLAGKRKAKVIVGSTSDVYGMSETLPFSEDGESVLGSPTAKRWAYAVSKLYDEHLALGYQKDFGVQAVILRYFGAFSERCSTSWSGGHVPIFIDAVLKDRPVEIHGDGRQTRSMAHMSDVIRGTLLAMEAKKAEGEIINIGNDEEISVRDSVQIIHQMAQTRRPLKVKFIPMKKIFGTYKDIQRRIPDLRKAKRILGYAPKVSFREGVRRVLEYRKKHY